MLVVLTTAAAVLLALIALDFAIGSAQLRPLADTRPTAIGPSVSVIVAARNEDRGVEQGLRSLLNVRYAPLEIIVVNDRSTDATPRIVNQLAAEDPRLRVLHVSELPAGWLGKNHALYLGAEHASGEVLLFTDADVVLEPTTISRAVAVMQDRGLDHLTALPHAKVPGLALNAFVAAFGVFFSMYTRPWKASDTTSRCHIGVGAFNMIRTSAYHRIGTHRAIALRPDDDLKLGKLVKKNGFRQDVVLARDFVVVEWYSSLAEMVDGLMKNAFAGVSYSVPMLVGATAGLLLTTVWPFIALAIATGAVRALAAGACILVVLTFCMAARAMGGRTIYVVAYPLAALLFVYVMWRSALLALIRGSITWRDTAYPLSDLRGNRV
jgi:hypothetical protein